MEAKTRLNRIGNVLINHVNEVQNDIGGVIGYTINLDIATTRRVFQIIKGHYVEVVDEDREKNEEKFQVDGQWYYRGNQSARWYYLAGNEDRAFGIGAPAPAETWPLLEEIVSLRSYAWQEHLERLKDS